MVLEITFLITVFSIIYPWKFALIAICTVGVYIISTICVTEWRASFFKEMSKKDTEYNQKATDSLLNFETVNYFNGNYHEMVRFDKALDKYK